MSKTTINDFLNLNAGKGDYAAALDRLRQLARQKRREYAVRKQVKHEARPQHNDP